MPRDVTSYNVYAQIQSQPAELVRVLTADEPVAEAAAVIAGAGRVFTIGIGTAFNEALSGAWLLRAAGVDANAWQSPDFVQYGPGLRPTDAAIVFSHTGRKNMSRQALRVLAEAAVPSIWIAGTDTEENPAKVTLRTVPPETAAPYTVSHTTAILLAARIADAISPGSVGDLTAVPGAVAEALTLEPAAQSLATAWKDIGAIVAVGAGPQEPSALEAGIKIDEAAWMRVRGYGVEYFLHGPQAQMQPGDAMIAYAAAGAGLERTRAVAQFGLDIGAPVAWVSPETGPEGAEAFTLPDVGEQLAPIVQVVATQLLAVHLAAQRDVDADKFRLDDPPFAKAFERYDL
ncbi:MAG TPA: hypothetical protein QGF05_11930 [Dehalococcoidia bacterium]|nr:hypothetical protein [Dehalococcoidia bacterium]